MAHDTRRRSHRTIKSLVFDHVHRVSGKVDYQALTAEVMLFITEPKECS